MLTFQLRITTSFEYKYVIIVKIRVVNVMDAHQNESPEELYQHRPKRPIRAPQMHPKSPRRFIDGMNDGSFPSTRPHLTP